MGGFVVVQGQRQTVTVDAETLREIAEILGIEAPEGVTAISIAVSSPQPQQQARSQRKGRAPRAPKGGSRRSSGRSPRRAR